MTKAFNGDYILLTRVKDLILKHGINVVIETGTYHGDTTVELSKLVNEVHTFEINREFQRIARDNCKERTNIHYHLGDTGKMLQNFSFATEERPLFFLDAHWYDYNPLIDELKAIASFGIKPVILIHDFYVPGKSTTPGELWGFDTYKGQDYNFEWVHQHIENIYGKDKFTAYYNDDYPAFRGCLIIEPKQYARKN